MAIKMNWKLSLFLLHLFTTSLPSNQIAGSSLNVLASTVNDSTYSSPLHRLSSITSATTIETEKCTDCYHLMSNDTADDAEDHQLNIVTSQTKSVNQVQHDLSRTSRQNKRLMSSSLIYGISNIATERQDGEKCYSELNQIYDGINRKETWAMKVLDSSGTPESGFVLGQNFWLGSMKGCEAVKTPHRLTLSNRFERMMHANLLQAKAPFDTEYRVVYASHTSPWQIQVEFLLDAAKILHIGLCLPTSCTNGQIANLTQEYFDSELMDAQMVLETNPNVIEVKDLNVKTNFFEKKSVQIVGGFILFTILMIIIAYVNEENDQLTLATETTAIDSTVNNNIINTNLNNNNSNESHKLLSESSTERFINPPDVIADCKKSYEKTNSMTNRMIKCFSVRENLQSLFSVQTSPNAVPVVDGIKSIGCFVILIFHMGWYMHFTVDNPAMMFAYGETPLWQWVSTIPIIVDVFFTISGLLLSYNFLRNQSKIREIQENTFWQNAKLFVKQLIHRYVRLTPLYLIVVGITEIATTYSVETSPFWIHDRYDKTCNKFWWRNVFYIQNLFHVNDLCLSWTWSMACEMQFFVLFTMLLFIYAKYPNVAKGLFCSLFGIFSALTLAIAVFTKFVPTYDVLHELGTDLYIAPWTRVIPYLIGVGAGYVLFSSNGELTLQPKTIKILWTISTTLSIMAHISTITRDISYQWAAPLILALRILYPSSVAWMIVSSVLGHGGIFSKLLNFSGFVHVNKLSYAIYLLNPVLISVIYGSKDHSTHVEPLTMIVMSVGVMVLVYMISIVFSVMFEMPYTKLSTLLWKRKSASKSSTATTLKTELLKKSL